MNKLIDKIVERLSDFGFWKEVMIYDFTHRERVILCKTIDIVKEEAKAYNNGWIPCSERLPEKDGYYLVTLYSNYYKQYEVDALSYNKKYGEWNDSEDRNYADEVIAWQPLPAPFEAE